MGNIKVIADEKIRCGEMLFLFWDELEEIYRARLVDVGDDFIGGFALSNAEKGNIVEVNAINLIHYTPAGE